jgi:DNA-directed RNA polymerase specialized sigma24 family protein
LALHMAADAALIRELRASSRAVERAGARLEEARERRRTAIVGAHRGGMSYRAIAAEVGITFPAVQQIINRDQNGA